MACSDAHDEQVAETKSIQTPRAGPENNIAAASASDSLIFPLSFGGSLDNPPPNFIRVAGEQAGELEAKDLMFAVSMCGPGLSWFEGNPHWGAIVIPSDSSAIWEGVDGWHPSDEEIIECVRSQHPGTFFYTRREVGYDTVDTIHSEP
jgi:hypothetical protein